MHYNNIGHVPSSLCDIPVLSNLQITNNDSNPFIRCAPSCLTTVTNSVLPSTVLDACPSFQDDALCGLIAATNIESLTNYNEWSCDTDGFTITDPCAIIVWDGVICNDGYVSSVNLESITLSGINWVLNICSIFNI